jgi:hypothetical protein
MGFPVRILPRHAPQRVLRMVLFEKIDARVLPGTRVLKRPISRTTPTRIGSMVVN